MVTREEEFNSNLNLRANFRGCTALHYAALADDSQSIKILLESGANPLKSNDYGRVPKDYARNSEIKNLLEKYSKKQEQKRQQEEIEERRRFPLEMRLKENIVGKYLTEWKFQHFSVTQILREINVGDSRSSKAI